MNHSFALESGSLVLRVDSEPPAAPYEHRCTREQFERVALAIAGSGHGITLGEIRSEAGVEWMEIATAIAFLKAHGLVEVTLTRLFLPATGIADLHTDAMSTYHALREQRQA